MKKKPYLENMTQVISDTNSYALRYKDGVAWDNKKKKTWRLHAPRGKVLNRFFNMELKKALAGVDKGLNEFVEQCKKIKESKEATDLTIRDLAS